MVQAVRPRERPSSQAETIPADSSTAVSAREPSHHLGLALRALRLHPCLVVRAAGSEQADGAELELDDAVVRAVLRAASAQGAVLGERLRSRLVPDFRNVHRAGLGADSALPALVV